MSLRSGALSLVGSVILSVTLPGCLTIPRTTFTQAEQAFASPPGFNQVRYAAEDKSLALMLRETLKPDAKGEIDALAISGGGANGAYGAGLLLVRVRAGIGLNFSSSRASAQAHSLRHSLFWVLRGTASCARLISDPESPISCKGGDCLVC